MCRSAVDDATVAAQTVPASVANRRGRKRVHRFRRWTVALGITPCRGDSSPSLQRLVTSDPASNPIPGRRARPIPQPGALVRNGWRTSAGSAMSCVSLVCEVTAKRCFFRKFMLNGDTQVGSPAFSLKNTAEA